MNKSELLQHVTDLADKIWDTLEAKNSDYTEDYNDAFENFKWSAEFAHITPAQGILCRAADKVMRIKGLTRGEKDPAVEDESLEDTIRDLIGYLMIYHALMWPNRFTKPELVEPKQPTSSAQKIFDSLFNYTKKQNATNPTTIS